MEENQNHEATSAKIDRRVARTRVLLREAMYALIREKGYDSITVEEITQRAGVGRATFYLHYRDKEDLLLEQVNELARDRVRLLAQIPLTGWDLNRNPAYPPLLLVFQIAAENASLYRSILQGDGRARIAVRLRDIIYIGIEALVQSEGNGSEVSLSSLAPVDFIASYLAGALVGTLAWWLDQAGPLDPVEMTRIFQRMFFPGAMQLIGIKGR